MKDHSRSRIRLAELGGIIMCLGFTAVFGGKYIILPVISDSYSATKRAVTYDTISPYCVEGDILDRNGNLIMGNASAGTGSYAEYPENYSYAWLLGYYTVNSGQENMFGLRGNLKDYSLFTLDENNKGSEVKLTTDTDLQNYAYELLGGYEGSIIVIDNDTGAVMCLASQSTIDYDVNDMNAMITSDVEGSQFRRGTFENDPPGSTFKVITAAAALTMAEKDGVDEDFFYYYDDGEFEPEGSGYTITNYGDYAYGDLDLESAMKDSVNCYFANLGIKVGSSRLKNMASAFMVGKKIEIPFLDTITSVLDFASEGDGDIAQAAFGQGNTEITPFHLAMIAQAVANDGVMMAPYIVDSIRCGDFPLYVFLKHKLSVCVTESVAQELKRIMHTTAEGYGLYEGYYGYVCAKTGTAECGGDRVHTYMIGFTEDASFCISMNNSDISYNLYPTAQSLVSMINSVYGK